MREAQHVCSTWPTAEPLPYPEGRRGRPPSADTPAICWSFLFHYQIIFIYTMLPAIIFAARRAVTTLVWQRDMRVMRAITDASAAVISLITIMRERGAQPRYRC